MKFDVNKFLTITALLATSATAVTACEVVVAPDGAAGNPGTGNSGNAGGEPGTDSGGSGSDVGGQGGDATAGGDGAVGGTGGVGGEGAVGGEGGAGGDGGSGGAVGECLGDGDPAAEACAIVSYDECEADPGYEVYFNPAQDLCSSIEYGARAGVLASVAECLAALADPCDTEGVVACHVTAAENTCPAESTAALCDAILARDGCDDVAELCESVMNYYGEEYQEYLAACMDPANESYDDGFSGTCGERLVSCTGIMLPPSEI